MIYLDHNASTYVLPQVYESLINDNFIGNSDSQHAAGRISAEIVRQARGRICTLASSSPDNIIFTSGATEANAIALLSYKNAGFTIISTAIEHKSVLRYADRILSVDENGNPDLTELQNTLCNNLSGQKYVLACMYANNETGVILDPIDEVANICLTFGAHLHIDASQCYMKGGELSQLKRQVASTIVLSGHKMHASKGVGALLFQSNIFEILKPIMYGGSQQWGLRPGTLFTDGIHGMGIVAQAISNQTFDDNEMRTKISELERALSDVSTINGSSQNRLSNTTNLYFPGVVDSQLFAEILSAKGLMVSATSACDSGMQEPSHVLRAMFGDSNPRANGSIRISIAHSTTWPEIHGAINIIRAALSGN